MICQCLFPLSHGALFLSFETATGISSKSHSLKGLDDFYSVDQEQVTTERTQPAPIATRGCCFVSSTNKEVVLVFKANIFLLHFLTAEIP